MTFGVFYGLVSNGGREVIIRDRRTHELRPDHVYVVENAGAKLRLPRCPQGAIVKVNNATTSALLMISGAGNITGVTRSGVVLPGRNQVRIPSGQEASFQKSDRGWSACGCDPTALVFTYGGVPLESNNKNPGKASGFIHSIGGVEAYTNPATNGAIIAVASSVIATAGGGSVLTDRVANPTLVNLNWQPNNQPNSWVAWQFPVGFAPTGLLLQTATYTNNYHLRSFRIHYSNDLSTALTSSSPVATWTQGPGWTNQVQITGAGTWHFFPFSGATIGAVSQLPSVRRIAIFVTGPSSDGANFPTICDVEWFGESSG